VEGIGESYTEEDANQLVARLTALKTRGFN
jgi:hypothetical protein